MPAEKRKPRDAHDRRPKKPKAASVSAAPQTSARTPARPSRQNLTLGDWLAVFAYVDAHPSLPQKDVVEHFGALQTGALVFTQPTLSRKLKRRSDVVSRVNDHPSALSSKRPRVVTRPDVERALVLWIEHMEAKGERFNVQMLKEKRGAFEELLHVPDAEKLSGHGWVASFCRAYKVRERRHHGEGGPPALAPVEADRARDRAILTRQVPLPHDTGAIDQPAYPALQQLDAVGNELAELVSELQARNRISGTPPTLDEVIELKEERETPDSIAHVHVLDGLGGDEAIVAEVVREMEKRNGEVIGVDPDSDSDSEDEPDEPAISRSEALDLCEKLMEACLQHGDMSSGLSLDLLTCLRRFRAHLCREEPRHAQRTALDAFLTHQSHPSPPGLVHG